MTSGAGTGTPAVRQRIPYGWVEGRTATHLELALKRLLTRSGFHIRRWGSDPPYYPQFKPGESPVESVTQSPWNVPGITMGT